MKSFPTTYRPLISFLLVCLCAVIICILPACQSKTKPVKTVRIAYSKKSDYLPMVVALENKYFEKHGINVDAVAVTGGIEAAEAVTTGSADIGLMGDVPAMICVTSQNPGVIVAAYAYDELRHQIVVSPGSDIRQPKDLEKKRFAVQHGSSTFGAFLMYCGKHNIDIKDIDMVKISPRDIPEAMASGQVDAMAGSQPWPSNVIKRNPKAKEFAVFSGLGCNYPLLVLATRDMEKSRQNETTLVLQALEDAITFIKSNPEESSTLMASQTGMKSEDELKDIKRTNWGLTLDEETVGGLKKMASYLHKQGSLKIEPDWQQAISYRFINKDTQKLGH